MGETRMEKGDACFGSRTGKGAGTDENLTIYYNSHSAVTLIKHPVGASTFNPGNGSPPGFSDLKQVPL